ncbi:MAG: dihydroneopterin aldolase [Chlamydiales bacterium]
MNGIIKIEDFRIQCIIGVHAHERINTQELSLDLSMKINLTEATKSDSITDTVDYQKVCIICAQLAQSRAYHLIETFAYEALEAVSAKFPLIWIKVCVRKKQTLPFLYSAAVEFERGKE